MKDDSKEYAVAKDKDTGIGTISEAVRFRGEPEDPHVRITAIEGTVVDGHGQPVAGAMAFAYATADMTGKPLFTSARTGKDGIFSLRVDKGGNYFVKIRNTNVGGHPVDGELVGAYGSDRPEPIGVKTGEIAKGFVITGRIFDELLFDAPQGRGKGGF